MVIILGNTYYTTIIAIHNTSIINLLYNIVVVFVIKINYLHVTSNKVVNGRSFIILVTSGSRQYTVLEAHLIIALRPLTLQQKFNIPY